MLGAGLTMFKQSLFGVSGISRLSGLGLRILVEGTCPSGPAVEAQLQPLLPVISAGQAGPGSEKLAGLSARIEPIDELLRVEVRSETGALLTVRDLERAAPCPALAAAAAVVIASAVASLPRATPAALPVPPAEPPAPPKPPSPLPRPPRVLWELGIGAVLAVASPALTAGVTLEAQLAPLARRRGGRLGLRLSATAVGTRRLLLGTDVQSGSASWTRLTLVLAPRYRPWLERPLVEIHVGPAIAAVLVEGSGFVQSQRSQAADFGIAAGVRIGRALPRLSLWTELDFVGWLRPQELIVADNPPSARLPAWDILFSAGLSFGRILL